MENRYHYCTKFCDTPFSGFPQFLEKKLALKIYMKQTQIRQESMNIGSGGTIQAPLYPQIHSDLLKLILSFHLRI